MKIGLRFALESTSATAAPLCHGPLAVCLGRERERMPRWDAAARRGTYEREMQRDGFQHGTIGYVHDGAHPFNESRGINMKQTRLLKTLLAGGLCAAALGTAVAQRGMQQAAQQGPS